MTTMYGPQSPAVAALVERLQAMTFGEAASLAAARGTAWRAARDAALDAAWRAARDAEWVAAEDAAWDEAWDAEWEATRDAEWGEEWDAPTAATDAANGLVVLDLVPAAARVLLKPIVEVLGLDWCPPEERALIEGAGQ